MKKVKPLQRNNFMKLTERTPKSMLCMMGGCPAIYESDRNSFVVIGTKLPAEQISQLLRGKVGPDEGAIEIPKELLKEILQSET